MHDLIKKLSNTVNHIDALHSIFTDEANFTEDNELDYILYQKHLGELTEKLEALNYGDLLYTQKSRQMILSDFFEYIFFGRVYYAMQVDKDRSLFIEAVLHFVNLLMGFESLTVSSNLRRIYLERLAEKVPEVLEEENYDELKSFEGKVGLPDKDDSGALSKYFDTLLPKTAGGLWHELLVYIYLLRNDVGYIIPLLLSQRLIGLTDHIVPPDFLVLSHEKRLYGVEVGGFKERQSSTFAFKTAIPTGAADTRNSRTDRCPICNKWINFCPNIIKNYADISYEIEKAEFRCVDCPLYTRDEVVSGKCSYTKYRRGEAKTMDYTHHEYANNYHYHYQCVLDAVGSEMREKIVSAGDEIALKTHYPDYGGLEALIK